MKLTIKDSVKALSRGSEWRKARNEHIKQEPYCQVCGREKELEVHHFIPWSIAPELRTHPKNLVTMCRPCHFRFGHFSSWLDVNENLKYDLDFTRKHFASKTRKNRGWDSVVL